MKKIDLVKYLAKYLFFFTLAALATNALGCLTKLIISISSQMVYRLKAGELTIQSYRHYPIWIISL